LTKRIIARAVAPVLMALAVFFSFYTNPEWYKQLRHWMAPAPRPPAAAKHQNAGPVGPPVTVTPPRPQGNDSSVSPAARSLILVRTQPGQNSREGLAQIGVNALSPQTYTAGALLVNGARLTEIYANYVVLVRSGSSARLYLQGEQYPLPPKEQDDSLLVVGGTTPGRPAPVTSQEPLTTYVRPSPVFDGTQLHGYALYPGQNSGAFSEMGLQSGDVVTRINGVAASASGSLAMLHTLVDGAALTVEVERGGAPQQLSIDGSILKNAITQAEKMKNAHGPETTL
jgi:hypothetical protein